MVGPALVLWSAVPGGWTSQKFVAVWAENQQCGPVTRSVLDGRQTISVVLNTDLGENNDNLVTCRLVDMSV